MTWDAIKANGHGRWGLRLMVEGWPEEFVTNSRITHANNADGRTVLSGLSYDGVTIEDGCDPLDAKVTAKPITFTVRPTRGKVLVGATGYEDPVTASLSTWPDPVAGLSSNLDSDDTTFPGIVGGGTLANGVYHMGTEAFRVATWPTIVRTVWDTHAQEHNINDLTGGVASVYVYDRPPTMEGRRCYLYVYATDDDPAGDGTLVWRGVIGRPAILHGEDWKIEALPITQLLKQTVGGGLGEVKPVALYFNWASCWFGELNYDGTLGEPDPIAGLYTTDGFIDAVNAQLAAQLVSTGADADFSAIQIGINNTGWYIRTFFLALGTPTFNFTGGSLITGFASTADKKKTGGSVWQYDQDHSIVVRWDESFQFGGSYTIYLGWDDLFFINDPATLNQGLHKRKGSGLMVATPVSAKPAYVWAGMPAQPLGYACNIMETVVQGQYSDFAQSATFPANRIYVDHDMSTAGAVRISDTFRAAAVFQNGITGAWYAVTDAGTDSLNINGVPTNVFWADLETETIVQADGVNGFHGVLTVETKIEVLHGNTIGTIVAFRDSLVADSIHANDGTVPFITSDDLASWALSLLTSSGDLLFRHYAFARPLALDAIFAEDLKLASHYPYIDSDGKINIAPLPTPNMSATVGDISGSIIVTPPDGMWPTVEPQRDGQISEVVLQQVYDAAEGDWADEPISVKLSDVMSTHKNRGKGKQSIKPYSRPTVIPIPDDIADLLVLYLRLASRDYSIVTLNVPLTCFDLHCGSYVSLSYRGIPNGDGSRGVTDRACIVVNRRWPMDPAKCMGTLTLWMPVTDLAGYSHSAVVNGQTGSDPTWTIDVSSSPNDYLAPLASANDAAAGFNVGDLVRIVELGSSAPIEVLGTITGTDVGEIEVTTDTPWDPTDASGWIVIAQQGTATDRQLKDFVYVADENLIVQVGNGSPLRRLQ